MTAKEKWEGRHLNKDGTINDSRTDLQCVDFKIFDTMYWPVNLTDFVHPPSRALWCFQWPPPSHWQSAPRTCRNTCTFHYRLCCRWWGLLFLWRGRWRGCEGCTHRQACTRQHRAPASIVSRDTVHEVLIQIVDTEVQEVRLMLTSSSWTFIKTKSFDADRMAALLANSGPSLLQAPHQLLCTTIIPHFSPPFTALRPSSTLYQLKSSPKPRPPTEPHVTTAKKLQRKTDNSIDTFCGFNN